MSGKQNQPKLDNPLKKVKVIKKCHMIEMPLIDTLN